MSKHVARHAAGHGGGRRARRLRLRSVAAAALGAVLVGGSAVSAGAVTSDLKPTPVGRSSAYSTPTMARSVSAQAIAAVTCRDVEAFSRTGDGYLYRLVDTEPSGTTADTMVEQRRAGTGWTAGAFAWISSGGDGVVYALTWKGEIKWYRYTGSGWASGSGRVIGSGFTPVSRVANIALGGNGSFYIVRPNGELAIYRHSGRLTGASSWASSQGWTIGTGWTGDELLIPNGDGTLYRQYRGSLFWYRHTDPALGRVTWQGRKTVGTGWNFYDVLSAGGGLLYATQGTTGDVLVYRHGDPVGGSNAWATARGVRKTTVRPNSFGVTVDPMACAIT